MHDTITIKKIKTINAWAVLYMIVIYICTAVFNGDEFFLYALYFVLAIPFIKHIDKYAIICFLFSTIAYFFAGADEAVWSIYSIMVVLAIINVIAIRKINIGYILPTLIMVVAVCISFEHSPFSYATGAYAMIYNMFISIIVCSCISFKEDTISEFLPMIASVQAIAYIFFIMTNGYYDGFGITVSQQVNHNTFGTATSILSIILCVKVLICRGKSKLYLIMWFISIILTVVSGSRNALLALILTTIIIYMILEKQRGNMIKGFIKFIFTAGCILFAAILVLPEYGLDMTRYDYISLISSGGSNRTTIWRELTPVIWEKYRWFGYGPSHYCSTQIMTPIINMVYTHTHNTIFEAWGELGFLGLVPFVWLLLRSWRESKNQAKGNHYKIFFLALFIEIMLIGLGESLFANISLWLLIGFILSGSGRQMRIG